MTLWDATSGLCTEAGLCTGAGISRQQHLQLCHISSSAQTLPQPLQSKSHTALVSRVEGVTIPASPQPVQQSPRSATMVHMFLYVFHVGLDTAAGDKPNTGLGLLQHLPLSHKA